MSVTNGDGNDVIAASPHHAGSPFERIKRVNDSGAEYWSSRDFAGTLGYGDYRNFASVLGKARMACFQSGNRIEDHFVDVTEMIGIDGKKQRLGNATMTIVAVTV